jgi:hypothetical protein
MLGEIQELREKAARCRAFADAQANVVTVSELLALAFEYDSRAEELENSISSGRQALNRLRRVAALPR